MNDSAARIKNRSTQVFAGFTRHFLITGQSELLVERFGELFSEGGIAERAIAST